MSDGFLRTGDIAVVDENGFVRVVDRKKDMIIVTRFVLVWLRHNRWSIVWSGYDCVERPEH